MNQRLHNERLSLILLSLKYAPLPTALLHSPGMFAASDTFASALGIPPDDVIGRKLSELPIVWPAGDDLDAAVRRDGRHLVLVGGDRPMRLHVRILPTAGAYSVLQLEDMTGKERELRGTVKQLRDLVDHAPAVMYIKSLTGRYLVVNRFFESWLDRPADSLLGCTDHELFPTEAARVYRANDRRVIASGRSMEFEEPFPRMDGVDPHGDRAMLTIKFPLFDDHGRPVALGGISTDITDRKRTANQTRQAREEAERANRAKSDFLSRMSHELRTPLNAVIGFGQLLRMGSLPSTASAHVTHILEAGEHLLRLVNEVLDLSWIEAGAPGLALGPVHAAVPLREALELMRPIAHEQDIELTSDLHGALHSYVRADQRRLKQALINMLSHAITHNRPAGAIRVRCKVVDDHLRFLVTDTGHGFHPDDAARLFTPFATLEHSGPMPGASLLRHALTRRLVEEMGGSVDVLHTAPGEGSTFYLELPLAEEPAAGDELPDSVAEQLIGTGPGLARVLYIEDTEASRALVGNILDRMGGLSLLAAAGGELGLSLARQHQPELVLLDLNLDDGDTGPDGAEVLRRLRSEPRTSTIPVIVVSGEADPSRIAELEEAGIVDYLTKPLDVLNFALAVRKALTPS
ncbi:hybrid sensor histidine kinase/response regulator [Pseudonocardia spinosispora]|uniref:hybrid sensor histidine kinase/response regulator n=1 Tax=Pseudonocardia spinosispora TaxID=103441 RepID=UPI0003F7AED8|nr:PAS domain-containing protein [Pseudonocardia spinosispora]